MHWVLTQSTVIYKRRFTPVHVKQWLLLHFVCELRGSALLDNPPRLHWCRDSLGREGKWQRDDFYPAVGQWDKDRLACSSRFVPAKNMRGVSLMSRFLSHASTHWQERRGDGETSQGLSANESLIIYCLACCLSNTTSSPPLSWVDTRSLDALTYTLCLR